MMLLRSLGEQGPQTAGDSYRELCESIALLALAGTLPSDDDRRMVYAANDGIFAYSRARAQR